MTLRVRVNAAAHVLVFVSARSALFHIEGEKSKLLTGVYFSSLAFLEQNPA